MTTYKGINGFAVQSLASDPSPLDEGQVWYNNTSYAWKLAGVTTSGTWASGGNVNTQQSYGSGAGALQTASIKFGGATNGPGGFNTAASEIYDGTSWTSVSPINTSRLAAAGSGTTSAALMWGGGSAPTGYTGTSTEKYDGSSWTNSGAMPVSTNYCKGFGTQTATIFAGGGNGSPTGTYSFNGSTWTTLPATIPTNRLNHVAWGTSTAGLMAMGETPSVSPANTLTSLSWNGSSWTSSPNSNNGRSYAACFGTQTSAIASTGAFDGNPTSNVELYNGSSWSTQTSNPLSLGPTGAGGGTNAAGVQWAGNNGGTMYSNTNEWTGSGVPQTKTITTS
jgi:hypothetical protein